MVTSVRPKISCLSKITLRRIYPQLQRRSISGSNAINLSRSIHSFSKTRRYYASSSNPNPGQEPFRLWPFLAITLVGSGAYVLMVKSRIEMPQNEQSTVNIKDNPIFSPSKVTVIFVLGGPGAGKGTQCANLVRDYNFTHLSAGDLLRAEQDRSGSTYGDLIKSHIKEGIIVPMEVTIKLLENAMAKVIEKDPEGKGKFLIDGFPRKMDQAQRFRETVCKEKLVIFYDCSEEEMRKRLLRRGQNSGRTDDNIESISKRFITFTETSMPVVRYFEAENKVVKINAAMSEEEVYKETCRLLEEKVGKDF